MVLLIHWKEFIEVEFPLQGTVFFFLSQEAVSDAAGGDLGTLEFLRGNDQVVIISVPSFH